MTANPSPGGKATVDFGCGEQRYQASRLERDKIKVKLASPAKNHRSSEDSLKKLYSENIFGREGAAFCKMPWPADLFGRPTEGER